VEPISERAAERATRRSPREGAVSRAGVVAAILGYALVAASCRPLTLPAAAAVLAPGVALLVIGVLRRPRSVELVGWRGAAPWIALAAVCGLAELALFVWGNDAAHPTISMLADPALATYPGRLLGYGLWLGIGAWLVSR